MAILFLYAPLRLLVSFRWFRMNYYRIEQAVRQLSLKFSKRWWQLKQIRSHGNFPPIETISIVMQIYKFTTNPQNLCIKICVHSFLSLLWILVPQIQTKQNYKKYRDFHKKTHKSPFDLPNNLTKATETEAGNAPIRYKLRFFHFHPFKYSTSLNVNGERITSRTSQSVKEGSMIFDCFRIVHAI